MTIKICGVSEAVAMMSITGPMRMRQEDGAEDRVGVREGWSDKDIAEDNISHYLPLLCLHLASNRFWCTEFAKYR